MSAEYNYDPDAQFFPFFVLTVTSLIILPLTYTLLRAPTDTTVKAGRINASYEPHHADIIESQRARQKRKELRLKRILFAAAGWLVMGYMIYLMVITARTQPKIWNPYDILDVSMSATEKQINSRYRRLSVTMHPDKRQPNAAKNETIETINDEWVEITKAYKALTDEEVRNNWVQYGNPDGKQSTSFGIALPQLLIAEGSGKYVLAFYGLLLGIGLPWLVGKWWYGSRKLTKEKVLVTSAGELFREWKERMDAGDVLAATTTGLEFKEILRGTRADEGLGKVENKLASGSDSALLLPKHKKKLDSLEDADRRKTLALLWTYLFRTELDDKTLEAEKYELAPTALQLNEAFMSTCLAYGFTAPVQASHQLSQSIVQAIPPTPIGRTPLLQLPHFTPDIAQKIELAKNKEREHLSIQAFMGLPAEQRRMLAQAAGLTSDQLKVAEDVARQLPLLRVERAFFKVQGEKCIIPSSLVQYVIKARFIPPGTDNIPPVDEKDLLDPDPAEGDLKAQKVEPEQHHIPLAYAPYFARDRTPRWHVYLADFRAGKVAVPPFTFLSFDKKPFDADGKPTFNVVTLKMQFAAPPQVGEYKFRMHLVCDSYLGFDHTEDAVLNVEDASKAQALDDDDDISEPEEDSVAGAMATLRGQPTADPNRPRKKQAKKEVADEESDYESGTDDEDGPESESETDTDTDSEAEDGKKGWW